MFLLLLLLQDVRRNSLLRDLLTFASVVVIVVYGFFVVAYGFGPGRNMINNTICQVAYG